MKVRFGLFDRNGEGVVVSLAPDGALDLALRNFADQRDYEDVDVLRRSALAARRPDALQPLQAWAATQGLSLAPVDGARGW